METKTCLDFLKTATGAKAARVAKAVATDVALISTEAKATAHVANTAADRQPRAKAEAAMVITQVHTADRLAAWAAAKVAVPVDAAKAGVRVVDAACSVPAT